MYVQCALSCSWYKCIIWINKRGHMILLWYRAEEQWARASREKVIVYEITIVIVGHIFFNDICARRSPSRMMIILFIPFGYETRGEKENSAVWYLLPISLLMPTKHTHFSRALLVWPLFRIIYLFIVYTGRVHTRGQSLKPIYLPALREEMKIGR